MKKVLVVGGGPCGIFAVGSLIARGHQVVWSDAGKFKVGRLPIYSSVPANTRNDFLVSAFTDLPALNLSATNLPAHLLTQPLSTTALVISVKALKHATTSLLKRKGVESIPSQVTRLEFINNKEWQVTFQENNQVIVDASILCLGGEPRTASSTTIQTLQKAGIAVIDHDQIVCPEYFYQPKPRLHLKGKKVAIVGPSHSGLLAARNAIKYGKCKSVDLIGLEPELRFAEFREEGTENMWIKYDGTGLKGKVREWTLQELAKSVSSSSLQYHHIDSAVESKTVEKILSLDVDVVAWTTGFSADTACAGIQVIGSNGKEIDLLKAHDGKTGTFLEAPQLFGGGIAFPEEWVDPEGFVEGRVGFVKHYNRHLDRMISRISSIGECNEYNEYNEYKKWNPGFDYVSELSNQVNNSNQLRLADKISKVLLEYNFDDWPTSCYIQYNGTKSIFEPQHLTRKKQCKQHLAFLILQQNGKNSDNPSDKPRSFTQFLKKMDNKTKAKFNISIDLQKGTFIDTNDNKTKLKYETNTKGHTTGIIKTNEAIELKLLRDHMTKLQSRIHVLKQSATQIKVNSKTAPQGFLSSMISSAASFIGMSTNVIKMEWPSPLMTSESKELELAEALKFSIIVKHKKPIQKLPASMQKTIIQHGKRYGFTKKQTYALRSQMLEIEMGQKAFYAMTGNTNLIEKAMASAFELVVEAGIIRMCPKARFKTEEELRYEIRLEQEEIDRQYQEKQKKNIELGLPIDTYIHSSFGRPTPDLTFDPPIEINGHSIHWIDSKNMYGASCFEKKKWWFVKGLKKQSKKYDLAFGKGAFVFSGGYCEALKTQVPNSLFLDASIFEKEMKCFELMHPSVRTSAKKYDIQYRRKQLGYKCTTIATTEKIVNDQINSL